MSNHELETDFIGLLLQKPDSLPEVMQLVQPGDLALDSNRAIYEAATSIYMENGPLDLINIKTQSGVNGVYFSQLLDTLPGNPINLAKQIKTDSANRWALNYVNSHIGKIPLPEITDTLTDYSLTTGLDKDNKQHDIKSILQRVKELQKHNAESGGLGISTGFVFLDTRGIHYMMGHLQVWGGFTSVGKTYLMVEAICRLLRNGPYRIVVISTEMTEEQIVARILANLTGFNANVILSGMIHENNKEKLDTAIEWLRTQNLTIYDTVFSLPEITARIKKAEKQAGVDIVFIDYLQNCTVPGAKDIYTEQSRLIKALQQQAKLSRCCIVALSQLSNSAAREDNGILEFKGAGEIAATADLGLKLNRYKDDERKMLVTIGKGRHWTKGAQVLQFVNDWTSLKEIEHTDNW